MIVLDNEQYGDYQYLSHGEKCRKPQTLYNFKQS